MARTITQDDAASDDDIVPNIRDLGKVSLSQVFSKEKSPITIQVQSSKQIHASDENSDDETLAHKQKRLKLQNRTSKKLEKGSKGNGKKLFLNHETRNKICLETKRYADQKGFHGFSVTPDDIYKYLAIIRISGYSPVPSRRCYWETRMDTNKPLVTNALSRNKFESIHRFFHLNDNSVIDKSDKIYKIRPLIDRLNKVSQKSISPLGKNVSCT
nr:unnamed protein product [Callosobruchus analis]